MKQGGVTSAKYKSWMNQINVCCTRFIWRKEKITGSLPPMGIQYSWKGQTPICGVSRADIQPAYTGTATVETMNISVPPGKCCCSETPEFPCPNAPAFLWDSPEPCYNSAIKGLILVTAGKCQKPSVATRASVHSD